MQDAAAALVARVAGDVAGNDVADLCAAPGGKTAGLAAAGAGHGGRRLAERLERLRANLQRLGSPPRWWADVASWAPGRTFDAVVLDAPCTATGTIRRHPDILRLKRPEDVARMADAAARACSRMPPRSCGRAALLVYSTCSLEPEEGEQQIEAFLGENAGLRARADRCRRRSARSRSWITAAGDLRTLPFHLELTTPEPSGMDGFYVARLRRRS